MPDENTVITEGVTTENIPVVPTDAVATDTTVTADPVAPTQPADPPPVAKDSQADKDNVGAPEAYVDFTAPEGKELNAEMVTNFTPLAKELNLTQDQAQKLVDFQMANTAKEQELQTETWNTTLEGWLKTSHDDAEIGGQEFDAKVATAKKALEKFGTPELLEAFDVTGVGNHPEFLRIFYRIGRHVEEDSFRFGKAHQPTIDPAKILFPNQN